jgi:hypothetical protein
VSLGNGDRQPRLHHRPRTSLRSATFFFLCEKPGSLLPAWFWLSVACEAACKEELKAGAAPEAACAAAKRFAATSGGYGHGHFPVLWLRPLHFPHAIVKDWHSLLSVSMSKVDDVNAMRTLRLPSAAVTVSPTSRSLLGNMNDIDHSDHRKVQQCAHDICRPVMFFQNKQRQSAREACPVNQTSIFAQ